MSKSPNYFRHFQKKILQFNFFHILLASFFDRVFRIKVVQKKHIEYNKKLFRFTLECIRPFGNRSSESNLQEQLKQWKQTLFRTHCFKTVFWLLQREVCL